MRALLTGLVIALGLCWLFAAPASACPHIPPLGTAIDGLLKQTNLRNADAKKVEDLRDEIKALAAAGNEEAARKTEEEAMRILGFEKKALKCGPGVFMWMKVEAKAAPKT